ncbi:hypothetical protein HMPREF0591_4686 [Mycobacterium parascrofulaceum ATCC BAA-614]|uniref:Uncharacterized protein n=1 Tax=Mycobacterium parascrofulaceum ATCC BAA-614 TaxID=525368 RepID=D5PEK9_9MYCO|nr:hypothetical protein HMPREF0591_4686 [Mycobacterium parascrofulaceum ATCC BAA-614]
MLTSVKQSAGAERATIAGSWSAELTVLHYARKSDLSEWTRG